MKASVRSPSQLCDLCGCPTCVPPKSVARPKRPFGITPGNGRYGLETGHRPNTTAERLLSHRSAGSNATFAVVATAFGLDGRILLDARRLLACGHDRPFRAKAKDSAEHSGRGFDTRYARHPGCTDAVTPAPLTPGQRHRMGDRQRLCRAYGLFSSGSDGSLPNPPPRSTSEAGHTNRKSPVEYRWSPAEAEDVMMPEQWESL